jgi:hypothetical protein
MAWLTFDRSHKIILGTLVALFSVLVLFGLHGYSISEWRNFLEPSSSERPEILLGKSQGIRGDDWALDIPLILAQLSGEARFPVVNTLIGTGQDMRAPLKVPSGHFVTLFRPTTWGFVLGTDKGLAWMWWSLVLGVFYSWYLLFRVLSRNNNSLSLIGAGLLVTSPYFQWWSFHKMEFAIHTAGAVVGFWGIVFAARTFTIWLSSLFFAWSVVCLFLNYMYPPLLVPSCYLILCLTLGFLFSEHKNLSLSEKKGMRLGAIFLGSTLILGAGFLFLSDTSETINLIRNTTYPGKRFVSGGGFPLLFLFGTNFFAPSKLAGNIGNICEAGGFFLFFPALLVALYFKEKRSPFFGAMLAFIILNLLYTYIGLPQWLARVSGWGNVTPNRTVLSLGLADASLLVYFLSRYSLTANEKAMKTALMIWIPCIAVTGIFFRHTPGGFGSHLILLNCIIQGALVILILQRKTLVLWLLVTVSFFFTIGFNPLVRGGARIFEESLLAKKMKEISAAGGETRWVVYTSSPDPAKASPVVAAVLSNLPRILGIRSIGGYHSHPHMDLWKKIDPENKFSRLWNQCGYVQFLPRKNEALSMESDPGNLRVYLDPSAPVWREMGITHFLVTGLDFSVFQGKEFELLYEYEDKRIYKLASR